jgi:hypothetical protein
MNRVRVQIQDRTGNWVTVQSCINSDQIVASTINSVQKQYKKTARAIDVKGNIVQFVQFSK